MRNLVSGLLLLVMASFAYAETGQDPKVLSFGVVPQQSAVTLVKAWTPILDYVSAQTGYQLRFKTAPNISNFESRVLSGEYDFAYMNPYHYTVFSKKPGYRAIARESERKLQGIIVVGKDSPISSLEQLQNTQLVFPSPAAFAASILTRSELNNRGINFTPNYVGSHDSVYHAVARGRFIAGGGIQRTLDAINPEIQARLRVLWKSEQYTPHAVAAHPRIPQHVCAAIQKALMEFGQTPAQQELLSGANMHRYQAATDADWNDVRALRIDLLNDLLKMQ